MVRRNVPDGDQRPGFDPYSCLMIVDVQRDFCPGGALGVPEGDRVVPVLNLWIEAFKNAGLPVIYTQDWHPANHCSFVDNGGPWPTHCVQGTKGAEFHPDLVVRGALFRKGSLPDKEAYSGFEGRFAGDAKDGEVSVPCIYVSSETPAEWLRKRGIKRLYVGGLATDYCVKATVLDGLKNGFCVTLIEEGAKPVDVNPGDGARAVEEMVKQGAQVVKGGTL